MSYYLLNNGKRYEQNQKITTIPNNRYIGSVNKTAKGRWYLEFTHISGNHNHVCGYLLDSNTEITFNGNGQKGSTIYFLNTIYNGSDTGIPIPFEIKGEYTLGLAIDLENSLFTVFHNFQSFSAHYKLINSASNLNVVFREITTEHLSDELTVNLGDHQFSYEIPYGYIAWSKNAILYSCNSLSDRFKYHTLFSLLILK